MTKYALTKYGFVFGIGIQNTLVYRFNFLMRALIALVPLSATLFLWQSIYSGKSEGSLIGAYSLPQMMSYYLLVTVVDAFTAGAEDDWQIAADIRNGQISQFLLKPMDFFFNNKRDWHSFLLTNH